MTLSGFGLWSGRDVHVEFRPAEADRGIVFVRRDLPRPAYIPVAVEHRIEIPRRTTLAYQGVQVEMVEHILAALAGLQIDNCEIWVDAPEMPGCDGSSMPIVQTLLAGGCVIQSNPRPCLVVHEVTRVGDDECWVEARPARDGSMTVQYRLDYGPQNPIGRETFRTPVTPEIFQRELAPARTFILQQEADWLRQQGLALRTTPRDVLVFGEDGLIENELRYENECVRHKVLDLIGDLALAGCDLVGHFIAHRSGHRLNAHLARVLLSEGQVLRHWKKTA